MNPSSSIVSDNKENLYYWKIVGEA